MAAFCLFQCALLAVWFHIDHRPPRWDESHYLFISEYSFRELQNLHFLKALDLHGVTLTKPGMVPFLTAFSYFIVGHSASFAAFAVNISSMLITGFALIRLSQMLLRSPWCGFVASLWFGSFHLVMLWSGYYQIDLPLTAVSALTVMLCVRLDGTKCPTLGDGLKLAAALAIGIATKHLYITFVALPVALLVVRSVLRGPAWRARLRRAGALFGAVIAGLILGGLYHLLNSHILIEQLRRAGNSAATGATTAPVALLTIVQREIVNWSPPVEWACFLVGCLILAVVARAASLYIFLWIAGGWIGVAAGASFPLAYYFLPVLPAFALASSAVFGLDSALRGKWAWAIRGAAICCAVALAGSQANAKLGSANPIRLVKGIQTLTRPRQQVVDNPIASTNYWRGVTPDGNAAALPFPSDWKTDDIFTALDDVTSNRDGLTRAILLTDGEWISGELFHYKLYQRRLNDRLEIYQPDFGHTLDIKEIAKTAPILITKSENIFKQDFYAQDWARKAQETLDAALKDDGRTLRQSGFSPYRSFTLPDNSTATVWIAAATLRTIDLLAMVPKAEIEGAIPAQFSTSRFDIRGDARVVIYEHPSARPQVMRARWRGLRVTGEARLQFGIAVEPACWGPEHGDGVEFEIDVVENGVSRKIFVQYIDPKNNAGDRKWHDFDIPLQASGLKPVDVEFVTRPGPKGDASFDHAGWSTPRIMP